MSKKVNVEAATTTTMTLREYFEKYPNASIRKLAQATGISYGVLLKKSKEPIKGEAYDPEATNWNALEQKLLGKNIDWNTLNWDEMNAGPNRQGGMLQKSIEAFKVGDKVYLRKDNTTPFEIIYMTATHVVIMKAGTSEPQAWSHSTFMLHGPVFQPRAAKASKEVEAGKEA